MRLPESETEFLNALVDAAELGAMKLAQSQGLIKPCLNERQAKKIYGRNLKEWEDAGLIKPEQDGPNKTKRYDSLRLEALSKASHYSRLNSIMKK